VKVPSSHLMHDERERGKGGGGKFRKKKLFFFGDGS
jgi:hypothetical protein